MSAVLTPTRRGLEPPPERYFFALGLVEGALEPQVVLAYRELLDDPHLEERARADADRAIAILRAWFRRNRQLKAEAEEAGEDEDTSEDTPAAGKKRRRRGNGPDVTRPAERHFQLLGFKADATMELIAVAEERYARALARDPDGKRLRHEVKRSASVLRAWLNRRARVQHERIAALKAAAEAARAIQRAAGPAEANTQVAHYLSVLGLEPGANLDQVKDAYAMVVARAATMNRIEGLKTRATARHAFRVLRRILVARRRQERIAARVAQERKERQVRRRPWILLPALAVIFVVVNFTAFRAAVTDFQVGDVVAMRADGAIFGTVVAYEAMHQFPQGGVGRVGAYQIRLAGSESTNWVTATYAKAALVPLAREEGQAAMPAVPAREAADAAPEAEAVRDPGVETGPVEGPGAQTEAAAEPGSGGEPESEPGTEPAAAAGADTL